MTTSPPRRALLVRSGVRICALPIERVVETLRPLAIEPLTDLPAIVRGVAVVRGQPVPVVELERFLSGTSSERVRRWVVLRLGTRRLVLTVDDVVAVAEIGGDRPGPLLASACGAAVESLAAVDRELLLFLDASRVVPEGAWRVLAAAEQRA